MAKSQQQQPPDTPPQPHQPVQRRARLDEEERPSGPTIKVRATEVGYYGDARRRIGDVFTLYPRRGMFSEVVTENGKPALVNGARQFVDKMQTLTAEQQFSERWMERVDARTPERTTTPNEDLRIKHDEEMRARHGGGGVPEAATGDKSPLGLE